MTSRPCGIPIDRTGANHRGPLPLVRPARVTASAPAGRRCSLTCSPPAGRPESRPVVQIGQLGCGSLQLLDPLLPLGPSFHTPPSRHGIIAPASRRRGAVGYQFRPKPPCRRVGSSLHQQLQRPGSARRERLRRVAVPPAARVSSGAIDATRCVRSPSNRRSRARFRCVAILAIKENRSAPSSPCSARECQLSTPLTCARAQPPSVDLADRDHQAACFWAYSIGQVQRADAALSLWSLLRIATGRGRSCPFASSSVFTSARNIPASFAWPQSSRLLLVLRLLRATRTGLTAAPPGARPPIAETPSCAPRAGRRRLLSGRWASNHPELDLLRGLAGSAIAADALPAT